MITWKLCCPRTCVVFPRAVMRQAWKYSNKQWERNPDVPDSSVRPNMKLNEHDWNPELRVKVTMTGMRWLFCSAFHNPTETQALRHAGKSLCYRGSFIHTPNHTELVFCCLVCVCVCVFSTKVCHVFEYSTCWLCCWLSWSCRARRVCKEARLALSSVFSWHTLCKRSSSICSFWVRRSAWKKRKHTQRLNMTKKKKKFRLLWLTHTLFFFDVIFPESKAGTSRHLMWECSFVSLLINHLLESPQLCFLAGQVAFTIWYFTQTRI